MGERMNPRTFKTGAHLIDPNRPGWTDDLIAFHRRTFGDAVMEDDDEGGDDESDGEDGGPKLNEHGFPDKTPWKQMEPEHQAAYWRHQAKRHESRANAAADYDDVKAERDRLKAAGQSDDEKAIEAARTQARDEARADERAKLAPKMVAAEFKTVAAGHMPQGQVESLLAGIHAPNFLTGDGEVDTDKVTEFLEPFMKDGDPDGSKKWPDMGQGRRKDKKSAGVGAGRDLYANRRAKK
jgi:hypothetical protein